MEEPEAPQRRPIRVNAVRLFRLLLGGLLASTVLVLVAGAAAACSCAVQGAAADVQRSDVVLVGTVVGVQPPPWRPVMSGGDPATYEIEVSSVLKGRAAVTTYVRSAVDGGSCGIEIDEGGRYVIFTHVQVREGEDELWASLCGGTTEAAPEVLDRVERVTGPPDAPQPEASGGVPGQLAPPRPLVTGWMVLAGVLSLLGALGAVILRRPRLR